MGIGQPGSEQRILQRDFKISPYSISRFTYSYSYDEHGSLVKGEMFVKLSTLLNPNGRIILTQNQHISILNIQHLQFVEQLQFYLDHNEVDYKFTNILPLKVLSLPLTQMFTNTLNSMHEL